MAGGAGRSHLERSRLGAVTGGAPLDPGDENIAARLRMPGALAIAAFDRRVLVMIEAGRREKAGEHHDRRGTERTAGTVGDMAVKATDHCFRLPLENHRERCIRLLRHPTGQRMAAIEFRLLRFRDSTLERDDRVETLDCGFRSGVVAVRHFPPWQLGIELQPMAVVALALVSDREKAPAARLRHVAVGAYHRACS